MVTFWEKLQNWLKKPKTPKEGVDFEFFDFPDSDLTGIHLLKDEYLGVIYYYKMASFSEVEGTPKLSFSYEIFQTDKLTHTELTTDAVFDKLVGDILIEIMVTNETGTNDTEKSDLL